MVPHKSVKCYTVVDYTKSVAVQIAERMGCNISTILALLCYSWGCFYRNVRIEAFSHHKLAVRNAIVGNLLGSSTRPPPHGQMNRVNRKLQSYNSTPLLALKDLDTTSSDIEKDETPPTSEKAASSILAPPGSKLRRLKDIMWVREALEDLTAAEFACSVEAHDDDEESNRRFKRKRKRAVDYEKLLEKLNTRVRDMGCENMMADTHTAEFRCVLDPDTGMGNLTYTNIQRIALLERLIRTRRLVLEVIQGKSTEKESEPFLQLPELPRMEIPKEDDTQASAGPKLYVRGDGTVDWDGALQDQAALRKFGLAVWQRINGRDWGGFGDDSEISSNTENGATTADTHKPTSVTAKVTETPEIENARKELERLQDYLQRKDKEHYRLLDSAISLGQATANIRLASVEPELRSRIQESADDLAEMKVRVSFQTLVYELERIFTYLSGELGNPTVTGYIPLQDRLNVAEFGLLESQVDSFHRQFMDAENVDEDVLAVVFEQLTDFKRRLGIDYYVAGLSFDREAISQWLVELWIKMKKGLAFYVKGVRLLWNDVVFCLRLINRAAQGYTLKPREVRNIRFVCMYFSCREFKKVACIPILTVRIPSLLNADALSKISLRLFHLSSSCSSHYPR